MLKKKRIVRELLYIFLSVLLAILLSLSMLLLSRATEKDCLNRMTERNLCAARIYEELIGMENALNSDSAAVWEEYKEHSRLLEESLSSMAGMAENSGAVMEYVRRIQVFSEEQRAAEGRGEADAVLRLLQDQKLAAENLIDENFRAATQSYLEEMRVMDGQRLTAWICIVVILICAMFLMAVRLRQIMETFQENKRVARCLMEHQWDAEDVKLGPYEDLNELSGAVNAMKREIVHYARQVEPDRGAKQTQAGADKKEV